MRPTDRIIAACASIAIATCGLLPASAVAAPQDELAVARRELEAYGQQLAEVQTQLVKGADELNVTESQIVEKQGEADQTQAELTDAQEILAEHMRENYRAGNATLISVLLEAETVEDLVSRIYYLDKIAERNASEIAQVRDLQNSLEQQVAELEAQRDEQQRMLDEAAEQAQTYSDRIAQTQAYYNELDAQVQAQLAAEAAAAAAKAQADATASQTNEYGVVTDGVQNAIAVATAEEPTSPANEDASDADAVADETTSESADDEETATQAADEADSQTDEDESAEKAAEDAEAATTADETTEATPEEASHDPEPEAAESSEATPAEEAEPEAPAEQEAPAEEPEAAQPAEEEAPAPAAGATDTDARSAIISMAYQYLGVPYVWGGKSPSGFDCSGLTTYCYENCGVDVGGNRTTYQLISWIQSRGNWKTSMSELQPGDMLFPSAGHVAIYLGNGRMIHAPHEGDVVREADVYAFYGGGWAG